MTEPKKSLWEQLGDAAGASAQPSPGRSLWDELGAQAGATGESSGVVGTVLDFGREIVRDFADLPRRTVSSAKSVAKFFAGPTLPQEPNPDLIASGIDVAALLTGGGLGALATAPLKAAAKEAAKPFAKRLIPMAVRGAASGIASEPLFAPREKASDPLARLEDIGLQGGLGAILGPATVRAGEALAPIGGKIQTALEKATKKTRVLAPPPADVEMRFLWIRRRGKELASLSDDARKALRTDLSKRTLGQATEDVFPQVAERSLGKLDELLDQTAKITAQQLDLIGAPGTYAKATREAIPEILTSKEATLTSADLIAKAQNEAAVIKGELDALLDRVAAEGETGLLPVIEDMAGRLTAFDRRFRALRSEAGRSLRQLKPLLDEMRATVGEVATIGQAAPRIPLFQDFMKAVRTKGFQSAIDQTLERAAQLSGKDAVGYWIKNIFPVWSAFRDVVTNVGALGSEASQVAGLDVFDFIAGRGSMGRTAAVLKAIRNTPKVLPEAVAREIGGPTALGERFPAIFSDKIDRVLFAPAAAKASVDSFFKRLGATSALYEDALLAARRKGLAGAEKTDFVRSFVTNAPDETITKAADRAKRLGFARDMTKVEEQISNSIAVKLFVNPFPRWTFQFTRFLAEHTPLDPSFWGKVVRNRATGEDFGRFVIRNLTGAGGLLLVNDTLYDHIDFRSMEYVREDGSRMKLTGLTPLPDAVEQVAMLRGDAANALAGAKSVSFLPGGVTGGIVSRVFSTIDRTVEFGGTAASSWRAAKAEFYDMLDDLIPGRGMLAALTQIVDPTMREGFGRDAPAFAEAFAPPRIDPTTGEPSRYRAKIIPIVSEVEASHFPRNFPFSARVTNPVEQELFRLGFGVRRPRRLPFIDIEDLGLDDVTQKRFEILAGRNVGKFLNPLVTAPGYRDLDDDKKRLLIRERMEAARRRAKNEILAQLGIPPALAGKAAEEFQRKTRPQTR